MARSEMDLREQAPRPGHLTLGEWSWLPRMIDKARAKYTGNIGNYSHPCGRDRLLLDELGLSADEFKEIILATDTDEEVLREIEELRARKAAS
jgi:hypothetical protein